MFLDQTTPVWHNWEFHPTHFTVPIDVDKHYHQVSDEVKTLDMEIITETIRAIALGTQSIINGTDTPSRVVLKEGEGRRK